MRRPDFTTTFEVDQTPEVVFTAINNVSGWWNADLKGNTKKLHDEFEVQFGEIHYSKQRITEIQKDKKVVWLVTDSSLNFIKNSGEWTGTRISFDISRKGNKTQLQVTHWGLVPDIECFDACSTAWTDYLQNSLKHLIVTGKGMPHTNKN